MFWRSITVTPAGMSATGVGTRVAVTTTSGVGVSVLASLSAACAGLRRIANVVIPAKAGTK